ncbi:IclR family transcriptional regulator [Sulfitobacter sp. KE34]|uniref:IclR family transcriptional regulator n=1 Tax=unclassified Sulfitobacter TaxID=196795 RepID=UPI00144870D3|nr:MULTISPECIES: IclR family transcriptional regulator [unclassified Sulfitobacter]NKX40260.1 IclR family transcriptional regulator [Rhodobacteraceae bacterium R_SAG2]MDF3355305.1 IclR family transcriptional regulator [Sulfitobacter sp. KE27]MDF3358953.1 IclR family transcriptional regulator [Sulfitobacter sp. KE33]MDF3366377.1 IclR family transcriptional regulator [Sulfitobacter sp. Ks34]MDF3369986.1 IclR family transcriptional regulator [Sulfitobacter sp. Ks43]
MPKGSDAKTKIISLSRGLSILQAFHSRQSPMTNKEMTERTGLSKATVTRLSRALVKLGYLRQPGMQGKYHLDDNVTELGNAYLHSLTLARVAEPLMMDFAQKLQTSVAIGVGHGHQMIYVSFCAGPETATMRLSVGTLVPLHKSAIGVAYLSVLPEDQQAGHLDAVADYYPNDDLTSLPVQTADTRKVGYSVSFGAWRPEIYAVGAPLWLDRGKSVAAINCGARQRNQSRDHYVETLGPELMILSSDISSGMDQIGATFRDG